MVTSWSSLYDCAGEPAQSRSRVGLLDKALGRAPRGARQGGARSPQLDGPLNRSAAARICGVVGGHTHAAGAPAARATCLAPLDVRRSRELAVGRRRQPATPHVAARVTTPAADPSDAPGYVDLDGGDVALAQGARTRAFANAPHARRLCCLGGAGGGALASCTAAAQRRGTSAPPPTHAVLGGVGGRKRGALAPCPFAAREHAAPSAPSPARGLRAVGSVRRLAAYRLGAFREVKYGVRPRVVGIARACAQRERSAPRSGYALPHRGRSPPRFCSMARGGAGGAEGGARGVRRQRNGSEEPRLVGRLGGTLAGALAGARDASRVADADANAAARHP